MPVGLTVMSLAPRFLAETERRPGRFDLAGRHHLHARDDRVVYGFVRAASDGWTDRGTLASFAAGIALLAAFVLNETRAEQPITPLHLFADRPRSGAYVARILVIGGMFSTFFFLTQFLQGVEGFSALQAGLAFLPMTAVMFSMGRVVPIARPALRQHAPADRRARAGRRRRRLAQPGHGGHELLPADRDSAGDRRRRRRHRTSRR